MEPSDQLGIIGLDHLYVTVRELGDSERFYDQVMKVLGFRKGTDPIDGEPHFHYYNRAFQYTIRPARSSSGHNRYAPGLHHICFRVADTGSVDRAAAELASLGIKTSEPQFYPQYAPDYYAVSFEDPDGIRLEIVAETEMRRLVCERWDELIEFENPIRKAGISKS